MDDILRQILTADGFTWSVIVVLTIWAATIIRSFSDSTALTVIYVPGLVAGALLGIWGLRQLEIVFTAAKDTTIILSAGFGMCVMLVLMLILTRLTFVASAARIRARLRRQGITSRMSGA